MSARHRNHGIRKICDCPRRTWTKSCPHSWYLNFQHRGRNIRISLDKHAGKELSKTEAETLAEELRISIRRGTFDQPAIEQAQPSLTLAGLLEVYQRDVLSRLPSKANTSTQIMAINRTPIRRGESAIKLGDWPAAEIDGAALLAYRTAREVRTKRDDVKGRGARVSGGRVTVNRDLGLLRRAFSWAQTSKLVAASPFPVKGLFAKELNRSRRLEDGEQERLVKAAGSHLCVLITAALETGCRLGEIIGLQWRDVSLAKGEIRLPAAKTKTARSRTIPISSRLRPVLEMRRNGPDGMAHPPADYVFGNEAGEKVKTIKTAWRLTCRRAQIDDLHFHDLRREAGSRWLEGGVPLLQVRDWLGHTNIEQTSTYLAGTLRSSQDAMRRFDEARARLQETATSTENGVQSAPQGATIADKSPSNATAVETVH